MNYIIMGIAAAIGVLQIPDLIKGRALRWIILFLSIAVLTLSIFSEIKKGNEEKYSRNTGEIDNTVDQSIIYPIINVGGAKFYFQHRNATSDFPFDVGQIFDSIKLSIWIKDGHLFVNTLVTDDSGTAIGEIEGNE